MTKLLMIADDMTGALDSGVMLSTHNINTLIQIDRNADIRLAIDHYDVIVVNTETRHLSAEDAYECVYRVVKLATDLGIPYIYKKTDSALRGNIGAELHAVLHASGAPVLHFAPAFPQINRTTVNGVQFIDGIPLDQSPFANDPLNPTVCAYIPEIISTQSSIPVVLESTDRNDSPYIRVYNTRSVEELSNISRQLMTIGNARIFAGCAAFIGELAKFLPIAPSQSKAADIREPLMVFCGSMHEQGRRQIETAERQGITRYSADVRCVIQPEYWTTGEGQDIVRNMQKDLSTKSPFVFSPINGKSGERYPGEQRDISAKLPSSMAELIVTVTESSEDGLPMIIGGDTLGAFLARLQIHYVHPIAELMPGVVLATYTRNGMIHFFVAKAGSFGTDELLVDIIRKLKLSLKEVS